MDTKKIFQQNIHILVANRAERKAIITFLISVTKSLQFKSSILFRRLQSQGYKEAMSPHHYPHC